MVCATTGVWPRVASLSLLSVFRQELGPFSLCFSACRGAIRVSPPAPPPPRLRNPTFSQVAVLFGCTRDFFTPFGSATVHILWIRLRSIAESSARDFLLIAESPDLLFLRLHRSLGVYRDS